MGWQDRDWARQPDEPQTSPRQVVWIVIGALVLAVAGYAWTRMPHSTGPAYGVPPVQPEVIYGQPTEQAGVLGVCTEYEIAEGAWRCDVVDLNSSHLRVARAEPYDGPCTHMSVDQTTGRWVCISVRPAGTPPVPAGQNS